MKRAAFVFFTQSHSPVFLPVLRQLENDGWGVSLLPGFDREALELGEPDWEPPVKNCAWLDSVSPAKIFSAAAPLSGPPVGSVRAAWLFQMRQKLEAEGLGERTRALRAELRRWLETQTPDLVMVPEESDYIRGRLAAQVTRELRIPTLALYPPYYALHRDYAMSGECLVGGAVALTPALAQRLRQRGLTAENIFVADRTLPALRPTFSREIVFVSQGRAEEAAVWADLQAVVAQLKLELKVKTHPRRAPLFKSAAITTESLATLLPSALAIVALSSSVLLQSYWTGIPALVAHYGFGPYGVGLAPDGDRLQVFSSQNELKRSLARLMSRLPRETPIRPISPSRTLADADRAF